MLIFSKNTSNVKSKRFITEKDHTTRNIHVNMKTLAHTIEKISAMSKFSKCIGQRFYLKEISCEISKLLHSLFESY